jgi:uncharacterized protein
MQCLLDNTAMRTLAIGHHTVDVCDACGGVWLDAAEIKSITDSFLGLTGAYRESIDALASHTATPTSIHAGSHRSPLSSCPHDNKPLTRSTYGYSSGVEIARCAICGGMWLDAGELIRIAEYLQPHAQDFLAILMLEEQKSTAVAVSGIKATLFLPARLVATFITPIALLGELIYIVYVYTDITALHKKQ